MSTPARVDSYLTRKAAAVWPGALVEDRARVFVLVRPGHEDLVLAGEPTPLDRRFTTAKEALGQAIEAARAARR